MLNLALLSSAWQNVKACLLFHKCPARSHTGWLNVLSRLVQFPLTHCSWLPVPEKAIGSSTQLFGIVSACRKKKETSAVSCIFGLNAAPLTVKRISSLHVMSSRRISHFIAWMSEAVWLLLPKQSSSPREEKDPRHEEKGQADFSAGSSISLNGWLDCAGLRHLSKHKLP